MPMTSLIEIYELIKLLSDMMVLMRRECEMFAEESNVIFWTDPDPHKSKSKMIFICGKQSSLTKPVPVSLCGKELPWVSSAVHLKHHLHEDGTLSHDIDVKQAEYIGKTVELREMLHFASPVEVLAATNIYCSDYYGSLAGWDLGGDKDSMFFHAWNTHVKLAWTDQDILAAACVGSRLHLC